MLRIEGREEPRMEVGDMPVNRIGTVETKGTLRVLKLHRETLRELGAGDPTPDQGGRRTLLCDTERRCTVGCGTYTKKC